MKDAYQILGINKSATQDEIKSAYRKLVRSYHPDLHPGDKKAEDKFKEITQAYELVGDSEKRKKYDRGEIGADGKERAGFNYNNYQNYNQKQRQSNANFSSGFGGFDFDGFDLSDLFSGLGMGGKPHSSQAYQQPKKENGDNIKYTLTVTFIESALGANKEIKLSNGKNLKLNIPKGTIDGAILRLKGQGGEGVYGGNNGDALITIKTHPHPLFKRDDKNITALIPISLQEAIAGGKIKVPTLDGMVSVNVPSNSNSGTILRLKGKGIETKNGVGDLLITLMITLPDGDNQNLIDYLDSINNFKNFNPRKKLGIL